MHTRKRRLRRGNTRKMKGGGTLDRLPVGVDSRNADGRPILLIPPSARADVEAGRVSPETFPRLGSSEAFDKWKKMSKLRLNYILKPEMRADWDDKKVEDHIVKTLELLPSNVKKGYVIPSNYEHYKSIFNLPPPIQQSRLFASLGFNVNVNDSRPRSLFREVLKKSPLESAKLRPDYPKLPSLGEIKHIIRSDFEHNWEFQYLSGHGVLAVDLPPAIVPDRTYIRFNSTAGCISYGGAIIALEDEGFVGTKSEFLDKMTDYYINNSGPLESFDSKEEREEAIKNPIPVNFCSRVKSNKNIYEPESKYCLDSKYNKQTIYMPGDEMPQQYLTFKKEDENEFFMKGLYNLPISKETFSILYELSPISRINHPEKVHLLYLSDEDNISEIYKQDEIHYYDNATDPPTKKALKNPNLMKYIIDESLTLSQVLARLPAVPEGKVRFLYINTCRGAYEPVMKSNEVANLRQATAAHARRYSLNWKLFKKKQELLQSLKILYAHMKTIDPHSDQYIDLNKKIEDVLAIYPDLKKMYMLSRMNK